MKAELANQETLPQQQKGFFTRTQDFFLPLLSNKRAEVGAVIFLMIVLTAIFAPLIAPYNPHANNFQMNLAPSAKHLFGTTTTGQDIFSQFIYGARAAIVVSIGAGLLSTVIALLIGMTSGYVGTWVDSILGFLTNLFLVVPGLALLIVIESYIKSTTPYINGIIIALTGWAWGARVFRAMTFSLKNRDYITAAKVSGESPLRIMFTQIAPNMTSVIASNIMYASLGAILAESGLAFLGLENTDAVSWGTMLYWAQNGAALQNEAWWWFIPPGCGIALLGLSLVLMNFAVDQITNPRLRQQIRRRKRRG